MVKRNKMASYNSQMLASKVVIDNKAMFASNYAKPELIFSHVAGERMNVEKITVRTPLNSVSGAYPLGEGLIFLADTQQPFEQLDSFKNFSIEDYQKWKEERLKDPRPLRPNEPVAFF